MAERDTLIDIFDRIASFAYDVCPLLLAIYISAGTYVAHISYEPIDAVHWLRSAVA